MTTTDFESATGLLVSGGLDSCILLGHLLRRQWQVQPFYIRCGLFWESAERKALGRYLAEMAEPGLEDLVELDLPLADLYRDHWSVTGAEPPGTTSPAEAVYLPGRNALLAIKAALWCQLHGIGRLALGVLSSNPFTDAGAAFFGNLESTLNTGPVGRVQIVRPFAGFDKRRVMELGRDLPLELTFSCIAPTDGMHCGQCNKCAERQAAFGLVSLADPTRYALAPVVE